MRQSRLSSYLRLAAWPLTLVAALGLFGISINGTLGLVASEVHPTIIGEPRRPMPPPVARVEPERALTFALAVPETVADPLPETAAPLVHTATLQVMVTSSGLVMHGAPGAGATRVWVLRQGEMVDVLETRSGWLRVRQNGLEGWVYAANTTPVAAAAT